jgi:hypothetical protein
MTINIGLVTSDLVVLGCDSVASTADLYLDPFSLDWEKDDNGEVAQDANGKYGLKFSYGDLEQIITNAWGGVTKMFQVNPVPSPMVAVTAGLAKLKDRPISSLGAEFLAAQVKRQKAKKGKPPADCKTICEDFLKFMRERYHAHYVESPIPLEYREGPEFLVGGFGRDDDFPSLYRVNVQKQSIDLEFGDGHCGVAWNGQSDSVERFIRGFDSHIRSAIERRIKDELGGHAEKVKQYVAATVNAILDKLGKQMPEEIKIDIPELPAIPIEWKKYRLSVDYANLPHQEAVNFVSFLVNVQAGKGRFARGIATVGGRTHIGVVTKAEFTLLNEPQLAHRYTGFGDDS